MKMSLNRFKHIGYVVVTDDKELPNGNEVPINKVQFKFIYAYLNESINAKLSNTGSSQTSKRMIAVFSDPRFDSLIDSTNYRIKLNDKIYRIDDVSKDETDLNPIYEITLEYDEAN